MRSLFFLFFFLLTQLLLGQKDCLDRIYQVADAGWISQSVKINSSENRDYSVRFVCSIKGLTATITARNVLKNVSENDFLIFISNQGTRKAFPFIDKSRGIEIEGQDFYVNTIALNWDGLEWLATHKVESFGAMDAKFRRSLIAEIAMTKVGSKDFNSISKCFYSSVDPNKVVQIETPAVDENALKNGALEKSNPKNNVIEFQEFPAEVRQSSERLAGIDQPDFAKALTNLAKLYRAANDPEKAEAYYLEAQQNMMQFSGVDYNDYPDLLNDLGGFYQQVGDYEKAKKHYLDAKDLIEKIFGNHHPQYPITLNSLGNLHLQIDEFENSEGYHLQAKELLEEEFSTAHPEYSTTLSHLSNYHRVKGDYKKALELLMDLSKNLIHQLYSYYPSLNEAERMKFLKKLNQTVHQFYSAASQLLTEMPSLSNEIANINLAIKGLALEGSISTRASLLTSGDSTLKNQYYNWLGVRRQLAQASMMPKLEREMLGIRLNELDARALVLEKELSAASAALSNQFKLRRQQLNVDSIRQQLAEGEIAIDFIHFHYHNGKDWEDSTCYYAVIIKKEQVLPKMIYLTNHRDLQDILNINITKKSQSYINSKATNLDLYHLIWKPIEQEVLGAKRLYLSPSGLLHQIAFAAIKNEAGAPLLDQFELKTYGSFRDLVFPSVTDNEDREVVLVGGAKFSVDSARLVELVRKVRDSSKTLTPYDLYAYANTAMPLSRALASNFSRGDLFFSYLAGTKEEVETIENLMKRKQWLTHKYVGEEALEEKVKAHSRGAAPYVMHIATHGYFFRPLTPNPKGSKEFYKQIIYAQNPLMRSGLVLTGANRVWKGKKPIDGMEDGILTAYEIANLDLYKTDLVVLSSCETGLGDVYDSEGIFGLQRALKSAGVRQLLVTLWRIPDKETAELMGIFYKHYLKNEDAAKSLRLAQQEMAVKYGAYYWAGFVLVE